MEKEKSRTRPSPARHLAAGSEARGSGQGAAGPIEASAEATVETMYRDFTDFTAKRSGHGPPEKRRGADFDLSRVL
jgi:hypothetical protein